MSRPLGHDIHATRYALQAGGHFTPPSQQRQHQVQFIFLHSSSHMSNITEVFIQALSLSHDRVVEAARSHLVHQFCQIHCLARQ